jgi:heme exporter protein D
MLNNIKEFLQMGGYAAYVWPAYGITLCVILWSVYKALRHRNKVLRELREDNEGTP